MKFRAEPKDLVIFCCFCVFLLYICCIGVLNASTLASEGRLYGLLPFEAFTPKYLGATLVLFVLALIGIFAAVSSYIFDRESGFGFTFNKKDSGYSRWARKGEIKKDLKKVDPKAYTADAAGLVPIGTIVIITDDENGTSSDDPTNSGGTSPKLGEGILGLMILG